MSNTFTDWNDAHVLYGLAEVKRQIEAAMGEGDLSDRMDSAQNGSENGVNTAFSMQAPGPGFGELEPLEWKLGGKKGDTPKQPSHQQVVNHLLEWYGDRVVCQAEDIFIFQGTHWKLLSTDDEKDVIKQLQFVIGGGATYTALQTMLSLFMNCAPKPPFDMFAPRYTAANFANGTLFLERGADYKWTKRFQQGHRAGDFLLSVIPLKYEPEKAEKNVEFLSMLDRIFEGETDRAEKIRAVRQMYGAMICSIRPHLFLLYGPAGGGKSTLIIPACRLIHEDNISSVEPHEFKGFEMESMVGKLVNVVGDIKLTAPIEDNHIKKIEDRRPVRIDRKYKLAVRAPLPPIHIFGANGVPPSLDGASGAHDRRWTFIRLDKHKAQPGKYRYDFGNWVFEQSPVGILNFALEGLDDLIASEGHYFIPEAGREAMAEWQLSSDPVGLFLAEAKRGEFEPSDQLIFNDGARIRTTKLWESFKKWVEFSEQRYARVGKHRFYAAMREKGYLTTTVQGSQYFAGIGAGCGEGGNF